MIDLRESKHNKLINHSIPVEIINRNYDKIEQDDRRCPDWQKVDGFYYQPEIVGAIHTIKNKYPDACFAPGVSVLRKTSQVYSPFGSVWVYKKNAFRAYVQISYRDYGRNDTVRYCYGMRHVEGKNTRASYNFSFTNLKGSLPKLIKPYMKRPTHLLDVCEVEPLVDLQDELQGTQVVDGATGRYDIWENTSAMLGADTMPMYTLPHFYSSAVFRDFIRQVASLKIERAAPKQVDAANKLMPYVDEIDDVQSMGQEMTDVVVVSKITSMDNAYAVGRAYGHDLCNFNFNEGPHIMPADKLPGPIIDAMLMLDSKFEKKNLVSASIPMVGIMPFPDTYYLHSRYSDRGDLL